MALDERRLELASIVAEQAALRRVATLVAAGATEAELAAAVCLETGALFAAQTATVLRWDGDTIRVIGSWREDDVGVRPAGTVLGYGGDTITARVVQTGAPARIDSADDLRTDFARTRWSELGLQASIGAPIVVDRKVWGIVAASRTRPGDAFAPGDETRLADFSALVAQAIVNADSRQETAALLAEQSVLREIATLVAGGRPQVEVVDAVTREAGGLFEATSVILVRWEGVQDEVAVDGAWNDAGAEPPLLPGSLYHPEPRGPTLTVLETGTPCRALESSPERGTVAAIAAPVIVKGSLVGALTAARDSERPFPAGAEIRLRSFADLAAQSIANEHAQAELRASRARIVQSTDEALRRLERNLHDGAQQRLVSVALALRLFERMSTTDPAAAKSLLQKASNELDEALQDLRELARGLHPALLAERGLAPALEAVTARCPWPVAVTGIQDRRLPAPVEAAIYYVVSESLTNAAKHAYASSATVNVIYDDDSATVEIADDGRGGATFEAGTGLRGLADRVEAFGGELTISSPHGGGTLVRAELPLRPTGGPPSFPPKSSGLAALSSEVSWEPVFVLVSAEGAAGEEMLRLLADEYGATGEREGDWWKLTIHPIDQFRRGTIIYRVIQASRRLAEQQPDAEIYLVTEDGNRWTLPPPPLES